MSNIFSPSELKWVILGVFLWGVLMITTFVISSQNIVRADGEVLFEGSDLKRIYDPDTNMYCYYFRSPYLSCVLSGEDEG